MFDELIGARLYQFDKYGFSVLLPSGECRTYEFEEDYGGCCGYNELSTRLLTTDLKNAPAITKVETTNKSDARWNDALTITFFGLDKPLAEINSLSSSESGWCYGAAVSVLCKETQQKTTLTSY